MSKKIYGLPVATPFAPDALAKKGYVRTVNGKAPDENGNVTVEGGNGASITVDTELSTTSENPVQNKVIAQALSNFADEAGTAFQQMAEAIPTDDHINSLIDAKLGVIENGSY